MYLELSCNDINYLTTNNNKVDKKRILLLQFLEIDFNNVPLFSESFSLQTPIEQPLIHCDALRWTFGIGDH